MPNWTQAQSTAIEACGADILVSAAAGSGKTAALTERILRHISSGGSLKRFLIVTFSRASAADMKAKLTRELRLAASEVSETDERKKLLMRALNELPSAKIGTIHSFCLSVLKKYHASLSLPARFRVADDAEAKLLRTECMNDTVDFFYSLPEDDGDLFSFLCDQLLGGESDETLEKILLSVYESSSCLPDKFFSLLPFADELERSEQSGGFLKSSCGLAISRRMKRTFSHYENVFSAACNEFSGYPEQMEKYFPVFSDMLDFARSSLSLISEGDYVKLGEKLRSFAPERLKPIKNEASPNTEFFKSAKSEFAAFIKTCVNRYFGISEVELSDSLLKTSKSARAVVSVLDEFEKRYYKEKLRLGILDYNDLEHLTLSLLKDPSTSSEVSADYDEIYIDECQDINSVQNEIFSAISKNNRFMVGDVKQSIYAFRGADPSIFDSYRKNFSKISSPEEEIPSDGASVFMSDNFRCDSSVIEFTNTVCGAVMPFGNVSYTADDELRHGKTEPDGEAFKTKIIITRSGTVTDENPEDVESSASEQDPEAESIALEIEQLLRCGKKRNGERVHPSDIAILLRSAKGRAEKIENSLRAHGIPVSNDTTPNFFECPEILLVLSLLYAADNPLYDIYLAGALRSPVFGFTMDDLIKLCNNSGTPRRSRRLYRSLSEFAENGDGELAEKCRYAKSTLLRWRELARRAPSYEVIEAVYNETGIEALLWSDVNRNSGITPPEVRAANLASLLDYARNYERNSFRGLHRFLDYISSIIDRDVKASVEKPSAQESDSVTIMTMHQSKGLEFPVVILGCCGSSRNLEDTKGSLLYDKNIGIALRLRLSAEKDLPTVTDNLPRRAVSASVSDSLASEEMRLLYVGLTRAKERLIISAKNRDPERFIEKRRNEAAFFSEHTVYSERTNIGWILSAIFKREAEGSDASSLCDIVIRGGDEDADKDNRTVFVENSNTEVDIADDSAISSVRERELTDEYKRILKEQTGFVYPFRSIGSLPAKTAISSLYPGVLDEGEEDAALLQLPDAVSDDGDGEREISPEAELAAKSGVATHLFMQFCNFENAERNGVDSEIMRLLSTGFIRPEDAELIRKDEAEAFFRSDIYGKMKTAKRIWREKRFNLRLSASEFTEDDDKKELYSEEEILVQGVIDCFFEDSDGNLILIDYKTDRLSPFELSHRKAAEKKLRERHFRQLGYYARALNEMFGKFPDMTLIYSLPLGDTISVM